MVGFPLWYGKITVMPKRKYYLNGYHCLLLWPQTPYSRTSIIRTRWDHMKIKVWIIEGLDDRKYEY